MAFTKKTARTWAIRGTDLVPTTTKWSSSGESDFLCFGLTSMQGFRPTNEDAHSAVVKFAGPGGSSEGTSLFGVFDGHGGSLISEYCSKRLHPTLAESTAYKSGDVKAGLREAFIETDRLAQQQPGSRTEGSTAVVAVVRPGFITVGQVGDSRCILCVDGRAKQLVRDHKPGVAEERARIEAAGHAVKRDAVGAVERVDGILGVARSFGDMQFKNYGDAAVTPEMFAVTPSPDVVEVRLTEDIEFMVLACDGIFDVMTNQAVVDFIGKRLEDDAPATLTKIAEELCDECLATTQAQVAQNIGTDNMSVIIVGFKPALKVDGPPSVYEDFTPPKATRPSLPPSLGSPTGAGARSPLATTPTGSTPPPRTPTTPTSNPGTPQGGSALLRSQFADGADRADAKRKRDDEDESEHSAAKRAKP